MYFVFKHKKFFKVAFTILYFILIFVFLKRFENIISSILTSGLILFLNFMLLRLNDMYLVNKAVEALDFSLDYIPLYNISVDLLKEKNSPKNKLPFLLNYAVCLREMGKLEDVYNLLSSIVIEDNYPISFKWVYYHNLSDIYLLRGEIKEAEKYFQIENEIYNKMLNKNLKEKNKSTYLASLAEHYIRTQEYEKAISTLSSIEYKSPRQIISCYYTYAQASLKLGDIATAKDKLNYIVKNGNGIYEVTLAKKMLDTIEN